MNDVDAPSDTGPRLGVRLNVGGGVSKIVTLAISVTPSGATLAPCASNKATFTFSPASGEMVSFLIAVESIALTD